MSALTRKNDINKRLIKSSNVDTANQSQDRHVPRLLSHRIDSQTKVPAKIPMCPSRVSRCIDREDMSICPSTTGKVVKFAPQAHLQVYPIDVAERFKAYTSNERKAFQTEAFYEVIRIQGLIKACPCKGGAAIRFLVENNQLTPEELLGIENHIVGAEKAMKERRAHAWFVVNAYRELREKKEVNSVQKLAKVAMARSSKNFEKARYRAALAA